MGRNSKATGNYSTAMGYRTKASGTNSTAIGHTTTASGIAATALGGYTIAGNSYATALGLYTEANGERSTAMGNRTAANGYGSVAVGEFLSADASNAIVFGKGVSDASRLVNTIGNSLVVGFNTTTPTLFVGGTDHRVGIGTTSPSEKLHVQGSGLVRDTLSLGTPTHDGSFHLFRNGSAQPIATITDYNDDGGGLLLYQNTGPVHTVLEPDISAGGGGVLEVRRNDASTGFEVNGNWADTEEPLVRVMGSTRWITFDMSDSGDYSVELPVDAVSSSEMMDEPGVASVTGTGAALAGGIQILLQRSITCPSDGYVLVIGTCEVTISHVDTSNSSAYFGVSDNSTAFPGNQDIELRITNTAPTATYDVPVTVHGLFEVTMGTHTFYLLAQETAGIYSTFDTQLSLVFLPTAYGLVTPTCADRSDLPDEQARGSSTISERDKVTERAESEAFNAARVQRELAAVRARVEALEREMEHQQ